MSEVNIYYTVEIFKTFDWTQWDRSWERVEGWVNLVVEDHDLSVVLQTSVQWEKETFDTEV